jgi:hypothetical protein
MILLERIAERIAASRVGFGAFVLVDSKVHIIGCAQPMLGKEANNDMGSRKRR